MTRSLFWPRCRAWIEVVFDGRGASNSKPFHLEIDPRSANVGLNGFYEADTWSMEFDTRQLPFDPDQVAYCAVRIYMWDSQRNLNRPEWAVDENLMVKGLVDDIATNIVGEDNVTTFTGRDYTAILADPEWDPKDKIDAGGLLSEVVQKIADKAAPQGTTARFEVVYEGDGPEPICGGLARSTKKKGLWVKPGKTYWDVIWDLCIQHAYVPRVDGSTIYISEPITQTRQTLLQAPRLVYGKTLKTLEVKRKFAREKVPQVVVVAYDPNTQSKIEVKYPEKRNVDVMTTAEKKQSKDALGILLTAKKDEQIFFPAPAGVIDKDALIRYARIQFYRIGRGETVYSMSTRHLSVKAPKSHGSVTEQLKSLGTAFGVYKREEEEINILQLRPGAAIGVEFDPFNKEALRALEPGQRVQHIISLGYHQEVANFISDNINRMDLFKQNYYYNRGDISYSIEEGIEVEIEAMNFASEVREIFFAEQAPPTVRTTAGQTALFSGEGPEFFTKAFAQNQRYATDPPWTTELVGPDETAFRVWVIAFRVPFAPDDEIVDYDMRGYWLSEIEPGGTWDGGHFPDTWKTPYDTTFSAESQYAVPGCPLHWQGERLINSSTGRLIFGPPIK